MITKSQKALLHIAKTQVGMTEDEYRDLLKSVGALSSADPDFTKAKLDQVMKQFKALGFKKKAGGVKSKEKLLKKVDAILKDLGLKRGYADSMARNMFGIDIVSWCDADQLYKLVAALTYHQMRHPHGPGQGAGCESPEIA